MKKCSQQNLRDMVIAQNDVFMLSSDALTFKSNIAESLENGTLTWGQLQRNAKNLLDYIMNTHSFERFIEDGDRADMSLRYQADELETVFAYSEPKAGELINVNYNRSGRHLLCVDYRADTPEIS